jgi:translation initiation factor 4G
LFYRLEEILEFAEDMEIDIPHIWKYLGELIGITITKHGLSLNSLNKSVEKLVRDKSKAAKLTAEVLISARSGSVRV